jgi:hypothetical protein
MKIAEGFSLRTIAGNNVVVPVGEKNISFKGMIALNDSGAFLWKLLHSETSEEELLQAMFQKYEIDKAIAKSDIHKFIIILKDAGILE